MIRRPPRSTLFPYTTALPILVIAPNDSLLEKVKSNMQEVRARGGELFVFADQDSNFRSEEHTSELQSQSNIVCRLLLEKKKKHTRTCPSETRMAKSARTVKTP